jgi:hypothetical protein
LKKLDFTQNYSYTSIFSNQVRIHGNALLTARSGLMNGLLRFCSRKLKSEFYSPYCLLWNVNSSTWLIVKGADKLLQRSTFLTHHSALCIDCEGHLCNHWDLVVLPTIAGLAALLASQISKVEYHHTTTFQVTLKLFPSRPCTRLNHITS